MANQRKGLQTAYLVTSAASLQRMQPPTFRAAPQVGGTGNQDYKGAAERAVEALGRKR